MEWWKRIRVEPAKRHPKLPRPSEEKLQELRSAGPRPMSKDDRAMIELLKAELTDSGVLDRDDIPVLKPIDDDGDRVFREAGAIGVRTTSQLPTYDKTLDDEISAGVGGDNMLLDGEDDYDDVIFDVYEEIQKVDHVKVQHKNDDSVELRLPDGSIIHGHRNK